MERRAFLTRAVLGGAAVLASPRLLAQKAASSQGGDTTTSNLFVMDQDAARTVVRPRKPNSRPSVTVEQRDALEHQLRCQCGCTLDVYTCRTTDFACRVSPAMHADIMALVDGGYSAQEIVDAFVETYGERVLMAPKREGFNWAGYVMPFAALAVGAAALVGVLRRMQGRAAHAAGAPRSTQSDMRGSSEELAKLNDAIRRDD
jgi:cytochrome c-type biogenesis protein CcmH